MVANPVRDERETTTRNVSLRSCSLGRKYPDDVKTRVLVASRESASAEFDRKIVDRSAGPISPNICPNLEDGYNKRAFDDVYVSVERNS